MAATMTDVARLANVSVSTVSYVLTGARPISGATRERVLAAIAELGYSPNAMARGLASRRSTLLGLLLPLGEDGVGATVSAFVNGAASAASAAGYHLTLNPVGADDAAPLRELASRRLLAGAALMAVRLDDPRVDVLRELGVPYVLIGRTRDTTGVSFVDIDFDTTMADAVEHLVGLGHRRVVYVNHSQDALAAGDGPTVRTAEAFARAMRVHGLEPVMVAVDDGAAHGRAAVEEALARDPGVTAFVSMNESATFGVLAALADRGLRVPQDVSVVSVVMAPAVAELAHPALTAMESPGAALGRLAVEALVDQLDRTDRRDADPADDKEVHQQLLPCTLRVRGTSGPVRS
ncbi:LacI family DNA-binding transcriptional regulator [Kineosporia sp. R_H_3]|uniref:LacI family DNA-binding transcriptional regulator n=1 Tax=Kineosporia sp. R_H_3 TaxID=1961848 RepID=UPI0018E95EAB|nr:LacI family DNA-binding transcriptional regulator [Kineosporia sp. R_H_3]